MNSIRARAACQGYTRQLRVSHRRRVERAFGPKFRGLRFGQMLGAGVCDCDSRSIYESADSRILCGWGVCEQAEKVFLRIDDAGDFISASQGRTIALLGFGGRFHARSRPPRQPLGSKSKKERAPGGTRTRNLRLRRDALVQVHRRLRWLEESITVDMRRRHAGHESYFPILIGIN